MDEVRNDAGLTEKEFLEQYRPSDYERPSVTVDMLVLCMSKYLDNLKVLLIQRKDHPYINCWALAGGFVGIDESAYQAACRELREETGIESSTYLEQVYTMSRPDRDPRMRVIDIAYITLMQEQPTVAGDDARKALWFDISLTKDFLELSNQDENIVIQYRLSKETFQNGVVRTAGYKMQPVSREKLAFDHCEIILEGLLRLRNKVTYSDIAFNLLPLEFTLPDLKKVYEVILGKELYKTNFKASVESKVEAIDHKIVSMTRGGKMAMGYRYKTEE
ncbi:mutT/NUDIX family protein [Roseburia sp. CAG:303]|nr:mutT/NUDIX family protein [Roseburia sp. CAG:303]